MVGDASNAVVLRIFRFITFSRAANWDGILKKTSSRFAVYATGISMSEPEISRTMSLAKNSYFTPSEVTNI
jgi:hypothetical protein